MDDPHICPCLFLKNGQPTTNICHQWKEIVRKDCKKYIIDVIVIHKIQRMFYVISSFIVFNRKRDDTTAKHSPFFLDFVDPPSGSKSVHLTLAII